MSEQAVNTVTEPTTVPEENAVTEVEMSPLEKAAANWPIAPEKLTTFGTTGKALYRRMNRWLDDARAEIDTMLSFQSADAKIDQEIQNVADDDESENATVAADYLSLVEWTEEKNKGEENWLNAEIEKLKADMNARISEREEKAAEKRAEIVALLDIDVDSVTAEDNSIALETYKGIDEDVKKAIAKLAKTEKGISDDDSLNSFSLPNITGKKASTGRRGAAPGTWKPRFDYVSVNMDGKDTEFNTFGQTTATNIMNFAGIDTLGTFQKSMAHSIPGANGDIDTARKIWDSKDDGYQVNITVTAKGKNVTMLLQKGSLKKEGAPGVRK